MQELSQNALSLLLLHQVEQLLARVDVELGVDVGDVRLGGAVGDAQRLPDVRARIAVGKHREHLALPGRQPELIAESVEDVCGEDGYAHMGKLGNLLLKKQPDFDPRNYGFSKLSKLIRALGRFDWKTEGTDNSEYFVRDTQRDRE